MFKNYFNWKIDFKLKIEIYFNFPLISYLVPPRFVIYLSFLT